MKKVTTIVAVIGIFCLTSCTQAKLKPENARKAINEFISQSNSSQTYLKLNSLTELGAINQFSDKEASVVATLNLSHESYTWQGDKVNEKENVQVKCNFKVNVDHKWIFTSIETITNFGSWIGYHKWIKESQNMNIVAQ